MKSRSQLNSNHDDGNDEWVWGRHRSGGGGAPLRDRDGNSITKLKPVLNHDREDMDRDRDYDHSNRRRQSQNSNYVDDDQYLDPPDKRSSIRKSIPRSDNQRHLRNDEEEDKWNRDSRNSRRTDDYPSLERNVPGLSMQGHSPGGRKFMSSLHDMNDSMTPQEKQAKIRKEMDYQNALRKQIEEKKLKKEAEKREEEEMKRREFEEIMGTSNSRPVRNGPMKNVRSQDESYGSSTNSNKLSSSQRSYRDRDEREYRSDRSPYSEKYVGRNDSFDSFDGGRGGGRLRRAQMSPVDNRNGRDRDVPRSYDRRSEDRDRNQWVPTEEYDQLSQLCDRLLTEQEQLKAEVEHQSEIIKDLQRKTSTKVDRNRDVGRPPIRSKSVPKGSVDRETNMASKRGLGGNAASQQSFVGGSRRPSSMLENSGCRRNSLSTPPVAPRQQSFSDRKPVSGNKAMNGERKAVKVAFGASLINNNNNKAKPMGEKKASEPIALTRPKARVEEDVPSLALNGFAKLQRAAARGPMVVNHDVESETEEPRGLRGKKGLSSASPKKRGGQRDSLDFELRGQSKYVAVNDDSGAFGNDQLDHLLTKARKGKYSN